MFCRLIACLTPGPSRSHFYPISSRCFFLGQVKLAAGWFGRSSIQADEAIDARHVILGVTAMIIIEYFLQITNLTFN